MKKFLGSLALAVGCMTMLIGGCGYSTSRLLPAAYRTIYIEPFQNKIPITREITEVTGYQSNLPQLQEKVARAVISQFLFDGNLRVITNRDAADLVLSGDINGFYRQDVRKTDDNTVEEYRLNVVCSVTLRDKQGAVVFTEPSLVGDISYFVSGPSSMSDASAVNNLMTEFGRRVVERVVENW